MMIIELLRALAVLALIGIVILDDFPFYEKLKKQETQFLIAIIIIVVIYIDTTLGFILALIIMLIYYEIYSKIVKKYTTNDNKIPNIATDGVIKQNKGMCDVVKMDYISNDLLLSAQNNIVDADNYNTEVILPDYLMNTPKVYGAQGVDSNKLNVGGYDRDNLLYSPYQL